MSLVNNQSTEVLSKSHMDSRLKTKLKSVYYLSSEGREKPCSTQTCNVKKPSKVFSHFWIHEENLKGCPQEKCWKVGNTEVDNLFVSKIIKMTIFQGRSLDDVF